jgi:hypothetical protein
LGVEVVQELIPYGAKIAFDFAAAFGLLGGRVHDQNAERSGDASQLLGAINLGVIDVELQGYATGRDGLAQAIERGIESSIGIELGTRNEAAGGGMEATSRY